MVEVGVEKAEVNRPPIRAHRVATVQCSRQELVLSADEDPLGLGVFGPALFNLAELTTVEHRDTAPPFLVKAGLVGDAVVGLGQLTREEIDLPPRRSRAEAETDERSRSVTGSAPRRTS